MGGNSTNVNAQHSGLQGFYDRAAESDQRVLSDNGEAKKPGFLKKGPTYNLACDLLYEAVSSQSAKAAANFIYKGHVFQEVVLHELRDLQAPYQQENVRANMDLLSALMRGEDKRVAILAYSLLEPAAMRGEPLTQRDILEVKTLAEQLHNDPATYEKMLKQFDTISNDPRLQVCLEQFYPGKLDGLSSEFLQKGKSIGKNSGVNAGINLLLPGLGALVSVGRALHKAAVNCDAESRHQQVLQIAALPGREGSLATTLGRSLIQDHERQATEGATAATLGTVSAGVGAIGGGPLAPAAATVGAMPAIKGMIEGAVGGVVGQGVAAAVGQVPTAISMAATKGVEYAAEQVRDKTLNILPRLEVKSGHGDFTFSMQDPSSVRALLMYLGEAEDKSLTSPGAAKDVRAMEEARLALKAELGSPADERLVPGKSELSNHPSDAVYKKLLKEEYDWLLPGVRAVDEGKASEINQRLTKTVSMEFDGNTVWGKRSPELTHDQISALEKDGSPSLLRLMYLAEGWL